MTVHAALALTGGQLSERSQARSKREMEFIDLVSDITSEIDLDSLLFRFMATLIGDGVNLAARLESACKQYHARILISDFTHSRLNGVYRTREVDRVIVKGKTEPIAVHEVLDYHTDATFPNLMDVVNHFREGVTSHRNGDWRHAISSLNEPSWLTQATCCRAPTSTAANNCLPTCPQAGTASGQ